VYDRRVTETKNVAGSAVFCCIVYLYRYNTNPVQANIDSVRQQRDLLLQQMQAIDRLRRGSLSRQFFRSAPGDPAHRRGPYYVLQGYFHGQKFSERIPADQAEVVEQDVANYRHFQQLAEQFVSLTDQFTRLQDQAKDSKKNSSRRKFTPNSSGKPKRS